MNFVSIKELKDWIMSQPDDRPVDMIECLDKHNCGCVMVQYGREHNLFGPSNGGCGSFAWNYGSSDSQINGANSTFIEGYVSIFNFFRGDSDFSKFKNYGDLKKNLIP